MAQKVLFPLLASWLALVARSATVVPKGNEGAEAPSYDWTGVAQEELPPAPLPREFLLQHSFDEEEGDDKEAADGSQVEQVPLRPAFGPRGRQPSFQDFPTYRLEEFPPGQPTFDNLGNLCAEGRRKLSYGPWNLPHTGFSHLSRQGDALNALEAGVSQCCQLPTEVERLPCCAEVWETSLTQFCKQEFSVKTRPHICCKQAHTQARFECFANEAPYPAYDKEITSVDLAQITPKLLETLCGPASLLLKQKDIPVLVQNITASCCSLKGEERTLCGQETKTQFIANLCTSRKSTWADPKKCCAQAEGPARDDCFNRHYLCSVAFASVEEMPPPAEPAA